MPFFNMISRRSGSRFFLVVFAVYSVTFTVSSAAAMPKIDGKLSMELKFMFTGNI